MEYRLEFITALELVGRAFNEVVDKGHPRPITVGGAAVEYYTGGAVVSVEDLIADRMGQFASTPEGVKAMLDQATKLYEFAQHIDEANLDTRIRTETLGSFDLKYLLARTGKP